MNTEASWMEPIPFHHHCDPSTFGQTNIGPYQQNLNASPNTAQMQQFDGYNNCQSPFQQGYNQHQNFHQFPSHFNRMQTMHMREHAPPPYQQNFFEHHQPTPPMSVNSQYTDHNSAHMLSGCSENEGHRTPPIHSPYDSDCTMSTAKSNVTMKYEEIAKIRKEEKNAERRLKNKLAQQKSRKRKEELIKSQDAEINQLRKRLEDVDREKRQISSSHKKLEREMRELKKLCADNGFIFPDQEF